MSITMVAVYDYDTMLFKLISVLQSIIMNIDVITV